MTDSLAMQHGGPNASVPETAVERLLTILDLPEEWVSAWEHGKIVTHDHMRGYHYFR